MQSVAYAAPRYYHAKRATAPKKAEPRETLQLYLKWLLVSDGKEISTVNNRRYILQQFIAYLSNMGVDDISEITIEHVDDYVVGCANRLKKSSVELVKQAIRGFLWYCDTHKEIPLSVDYLLIRRHKDKPQRVPYITTEQVQLAVSTCDNAQDALMICVLYDTGVRIGELVKISVEDIRGTEIHVRGKGSYDRTVYMTEELARKLHRHTMELGIRSGPVFRHQMHISGLIDDTYSTCRARERIQRCFEQTGVFVKPHWLRHAFAIRWLQLGGDLRTLQKILGHSSLEVTQRYLNITDSFTEEAYKRIITKTIVF